jgi:glycerol-3-phosphate acyltransferase PlsX
LEKHDTQGLKLELVHASQVIEMTDKPAAAAKAKKDSSLLVGMNLVRDGKADAFVSAGNTGGLLAVATLFSVKRIRGIKRPAITAVLPLAGKRVTLLDAGANADCEPIHLLQFGMMGSVYNQRVLGIDNPRVALLSNGEEPGKGNELVKQTYKLFEDSKLNFVGNVEGKEMIAGEADVVVSDGFTGNVALKTLEATAKMLNNSIRHEFMSNPLSMLGGLLAKPAFRRVAKSIDPYEVGGVPLLGVNGIVIGAHGRSNGWAMRNAIRQARLAVQGDMVNAIKQGLEEFSR